MVIEFGGYYGDTATDYALAHFKDYEALRNIGNSERLCQIIAERWCVVRYDFRVYGKYNPDIKEALDLAGCNGYRVDTDGVRAVDKLIYITTNAPRIAIDFKGGAYRPLIADDEAICSNCGAVVKKYSIVGAYCDKCLNGTNGLLYKYDYHEYCGGYSIHEKVDTNKTPVFGCEIERDYIEYRNDNEDEDECCGFEADKNAALHEVGAILYDNFEKVQPRSHVFMHDGSLNYGGIEWITFPKTYKWYKDHKYKLQDALDAFYSFGFRNSSSVGNHIHINKNYFGKSAKYCAAKWSVLLSKYWSEFKVIANRDCTDYTSRPTQEATDDVFTICEKTLNAEHEHCVAINLQHANTIECRLWGGIDNADDLLLYLDIMQSMAKFVKIASLERCQKCDFVAVFKHLKDKDEHIKLIEQRLRSNGYNDAANRLVACYSAEV